MPAIATKSPPVLGNVVASSPIKMSFLAFININCQAHQYIDGSKTKNVYIGLLTRLKYEFTRLEVLLYPWKCMHSIIPQKLEVINFTRFMFCSSGFC